METIKRVLTFKEGCELLGLRPNWVYKLTSRRQIPFSKPRGRIYFDRQELEAWMLGQRVPTQAEIERQAKNLIKR